MNVLDAINRKSRVHEASDRVRAGRNKLKGGTFEAAGDVRSSMADARAAFRGAIGQTRESLDAARRASREAVKDTRSAARSRGKEARRAGRRAYVDARVSAARRTASRPEGASKKSVGIAGALGAAGAYFLDPESGSRRRIAARERATALARRTANRLHSQADDGAGRQVAGAAMQRDGSPYPPANGVRSAASTSPQGS